MEVILNGEPFSMDQSCSVDQLVESLQLEGKFAIELNQSIVPRSEFIHIKIQQGDKIEIVQAIGGG